MYEKPLPMARRTGTDWRTCGIIRDRQEVCHSQSLERQARFQAPSLSWMDAKEIEPWRNFEYLESNCEPRFKMESSTDESSRNPRNATNYTAPSRSRTDSAIGPLLFLHKNVAVGSGDTGPTNYRPEGEDEPEGYQWPGEIKNGQDLLVDKFLERPNSHDAELRVILHYPNALVVPEGRAFENLTRLGVTRPGIRTSAVHVGAALKVAAVLVHCHVKPGEVPAASCEPHISSARIVRRSVHVHPMPEPEPA